LASVTRRDANRQGRNVDQGSPQERDLVVLDVGSVLLFIRRDPLVLPPL